MRCGIPEGLISHILYLISYVLINFAQQRDPLEFVGMSERNAFPRGEGAPKGRMRNVET